MPWNTSDQTNGLESIKAKVYWDKDGGIDEDGIWVCEVPTQITASSVGWQRTKYARRTTVRWDEAIDLYIRWFDHVIVNGNFEATFRDGVFLVEC
ncbi:hypothetical protein HWC80_gp093 [Mycobacterium phage Indlulamithi]|uniref:Uncharacterized protein n=1 Tax=Mycobacterium phage Indlulamithi TaxID=2656582 RepID=A0A649VDC8_9CAUD|nr:hypothetical protein HWC80_gp093 [Mycobacterium phage Indlulamithi]QGJ90119.1 hypothetical protein PBI_INDLULAMITHI_81 [Mycobacterium phage Indlulamithi]